MQINYIGNWRDIEDSYKVDFNNKPRLESKLKINKFGSTPFFYQCEYV